MGTSCSSCGCNEQTSEFNTGQVYLEDSQKIGTSQSQKTDKNKMVQDNKPLKKSVSTNPNFQHLQDKIGGNLSQYTPYLKYIIKMQAAWRGYSARQQIALVKQMKRADSRYFTVEEQRETVSKTPYNPNAQREKRPIYVFKSGATYIGQWKGGFRDGFGKQTWPDGACYEGNWKDNRACGQGKFTHIDGDIYEGNWVNDKANGLGTYIHVNGARYEGMWKDDLQHGRGDESWTDGSVYNGEYLGGKKHGRGVYSWNDGSKYDGDWFENKIKGLGVYTWLDGREYKGEWIDNNMDGVGVYTWQDGRKYEGEYKDDKKHGFGIYVWSDGRVYRGNWFKGKQHGLGIYTVPNQGEKFGLWEDGKRIEWFDKKQVEMVESGEVDFRTFFRKQESGLSVDLNGFFHEPNNFRARITQTLKKFPLRPIPSENQKNGGEKR